MKIFFDMDGTIVDFYNVDNWLDYLKNEDTYPYEHAKGKVNLSHLARLLHKVQKEGHKIGIISWTAKSGSRSFNERVKEAKMEWLKKHLPSVEWDEIHIINYGLSKVKCGNGILFDDELMNRWEWGDLGFKPDAIFDVLQAVLEG